MIEPSKPERRLAKLSWEWNGKRAIHGRAQVDYATKQVQLSMSNAPWTWSLDRSIGKCQWICIGLGADVCIFYMKSMALLACRHAEGERYE